MEVRHGGDQPVMAMANTVHPFMRAFESEIEARKVGASEPAPADSRQPPSDVADELLAVRGE